MLNLLDEPVALDTLELYYLELKMVEPVEVHNNFFSSRPIIICRLISKGAQGFSELDALNYPSYEEEFLDGALFVIKEFIVKKILKSIKKPLSYQLLSKSLDDHIKGNFHAKSAIRIAFLDLLLNRNSIPVNLFLKDFFSEPKKPSYGRSCSIGIYKSKEDLFMKAKEVIKKGFDVIRVKISPEVNPSWLKQLREELPDVDITLDANGSFNSFSEAVNYFVSVDDCGFLFIDQPFGADRLYDHRRLTDHIKTPISLDESVRSKWSIQNVIEIGAAEYFCIKPGRVGGLLEALDMIQYVSSYGLKPWIGGMYNSEIGQSVVANLLPWALFGDLPLNHNFEPQLINNPFWYKKEFNYPNSAGFGMAVAKAKLEKNAFRIETFNLGT
jgi:O-succinylbenzoate synthase